MHATALLLDDRGVLISGPSGSGKTTLALALIAQFAAAGRFARLVADDQLLVSAHAGRLVVSAPQSISGLVEIHGLGPCPVEHQGSAVIDLVVRLVEQGEAPRFQDTRTETISGIGIPLLALPARSVTASATAVTGWLKALPHR
jgi:serine kinase of HPr protein (carbohydrate metabolism regulator)